MSIAHSTRPTPMAKVNDLPWLLPLGSPIWRRGLCTVAQPCLTRAQHTPKFLFQDATVLLIAAGRLNLDCGIDKIEVNAGAALMLVEANACADLVKTPGGMEQRFRSIFLTIAPELLDAFRRSRTTGSENSPAAATFRTMPLDADLGDSLQHVLEGATSQQISDERLQYRVLEFLATLAERGFIFSQAMPTGMSGRLRALIGAAPGQHWTAQIAGKALAVSEATLRRRLADECARFEDVLIDVRMHHAMMLAQTTSWSVSEIAQACGYRSRTRFTERFRARFGYSPSAIR